MNIAVDRPFPLSVEQHIRCEPGGDAWLYGKGWSLDRHDFTKDGPCRLAINEACLVVPGAAGVLIDPEPLERVARASFGGLVFVSDRIDRAFEFVDVALKRIPRWVYFKKGHYNKPGTAPCAIGILADLGAKRIHMVGFDLFFRPGQVPPDASALNPYAKVIEPMAHRFGKLRRNTDYEVINEAIRLQAAHSAVELVDAST